MKTIKLLMFTAIVGLIACGSPTDQQTEEKDSEGEEMAEGINIMPTDPSASFEDAAIRSMNFKDGTFDFKLGGEKYELGVQTPDAPQKMCANSAKGQHIHLIVDDQPYSAQYEATFPYEIEDGEHYLLAFLSRSYHESIKTDSAHVAKKVMIKDNSITSSADIERPMLFYSRPKGAYQGKDTKNVLLDFYPVNVTLGNEYKVKVDVNDGAFTKTLDDWRPYYIKGLPNGNNTISLTLIDAEGNRVETPLNPVSRTITIQKNPKENPQ